MALQEGGMACPHAQTLPHPVTEDEARVEHGHDRPLARHELVVDPDEDALVARVVLEVVRAVGHGAKSYGPQCPPQAFFPNWWACTFSWSATSC